MLGNKTREVNNFFTAISASPCFAEHLKNAVSNSVCLSCKGYKRITSWSVGLCDECHQRVDRQVANKARENFSVSVVVTEKN